MVALLLARAGYFSGSIEEVMNARVDYVLQSYFYELYMQDYEYTFQEMNTKRK